MNGKVVEEEEEEEEEEEDYSEPDIEEELLASERHAGPGEQNRLLQIRPSDPQQPEDPGWRLSPSQRAVGVVGGPHEDG